MASAEMTSTPSAVLPPGAANVEDDVKAFEAAGAARQDQADGRRG